MKVPDIFAGPEVWETYLKQCNETEIDLLYIEIGKIGKVIQKMIIAELEKRVN